MTATGCTVKDNLMKFD